MPATAGQGVCALAKVDGLDAIAGSVAVGRNRLFAPIGAPGSARLAAWPGACQVGCARLDDLAEPLVGDPVIAGELAYFMGATSILAVRADCLGCDPVWRAMVRSHGLRVTPVVVDGMVLVSAASDRVAGVRVYELPED